jgi:YHS domain-containing protein
MDESRTVSCPVCGKEVDTLRARAVGIYAGKTQYFCSADCKAQFTDPRKTPRTENNKPASEPASTSAAARPEPAPRSEPVAKTAPHEVAKAARDEAEQEQNKIRKDPSPSIEEDAEAWNGGGGGKVWAVVLMLFVAAGVVLYFAFVKK